MARAEDVISQLNLLPHPEGGYYREIFRQEAPGGGRALSTAIYYLLKAGQESAWHRIDAVEMWHFYGGAPLLLRVGPNATELDDVTLGSDLSQGHSPTSIVPVGHWQAARSLGDFSLVGCTVTPGFEFSGFELAKEGHRRAFVGELPESGAPSWTRP